MAPCVNQPSIVLQECWLTEASDTDILKIPGYKLQFLQNRKKAWLDYLYIRKIFLDVSYGIRLSLSISDPDVKIGLLG